MFDNANPIVQRLVSAGYRVSMHGYAKRLATRFHARADDGSQTFTANGSTAAAALRALDREVRAAMVTCPEAPGD